ncbi:hypothetical protein BDP27DRAFT_1365308 [Rhodocollybia butyracea]|uniref:Uncharacterized protein n=1 Tax=Rhodocollybia butyracea TaxID=206335 RepID=A0A9P5PR01_9AGAR|nr:hypothetical protein BDP27DRAFT_1365308 [Rhodocollybia butyracea]
MSNIISYLCQFIARQAVDFHLDIKKPFSGQAVLMLGKARQHVKSAILQFSAHQKHWGADLLLKDQFKSKKDTLSAKERREKEKREEGEKEQQENEKRTTKKKPTSDVRPLL